MIWFTEAPSNIALIKYMGRKDEAKKIPENASLSYTLPHLKSFVELEVSSQNKSYWKPLTFPEILPLILSQQGQQRFLNHLQRIQDYFSYKGYFVVRSGNNFPQASGLASSASSFAALTLAAVKAICSLTHQTEPPIKIIAQLSRLGSGSSCRSFYAPWALWRDESVESIQLPYTQLNHQVVMLDQTEKSVLSSEAHRQVQTSPFYTKRQERAEKRLSLLLDALKNKHWSDAYAVTWEEFQDMHHLFETALPAFSYRSEASLSLLNQLRNYWEKKGDGPLITMDAGPNIHLLYREDQQEIQSEIEHHYLRAYHVFSS